MRYYNPWTLRFLSVDPLAADYPFYTPYQYAGNKPINHVDIDGMEEGKSGEGTPQTTKPEKGPEFKPLTKDQLNSLLKSDNPPSGPLVLQSINNSRRVY